MRSKLLNLSTTFIILLGSALVFITACSAQPGARQQNLSPTGVQGTLVELSAGQIDTDTPVPAPIDPLLSQASTLLDGQSLLEKYCLRCHLPQWIDQIDKSRSEWLETLELMAAMGVQIDENDKDVLLDYLNSENAP